MEKGRDCSLVGVASLNLDLDRSRPGSLPLFWRWGGGMRGGAVSGGGPALFDPVPGSRAGSWVEGGVGTGGGGLVRGCGGALTVSCGGGGLVRGGGSGHAGAAVGAPHLLMPAAFAIRSRPLCKPAGDLPRTWRLLESARSCAGIVALGGAVGCCSGSVVWLFTWGFVVAGGSE